MRLIDADALKKNKVYSRPRREYVVPVAYIDWSETIDPVRHAHWIEDDDGDGRHCSGCGHDYCYMLGDPEIFEFCPFCGTKMDEKGAVTDGEDKG